jgi:hypothetical protein
VLVGPRAHVRREVGREAALDRHKPRGRGPTQQSAQVQLFKA